MYDFTGIYQEMIYFGVLGVVGITMIVQSKFWNKNKRNIGDMLLLSLIHISEPTRH